MEQKMTEEFTIGQCLEAYREGKRFLYRNEKGVSRDGRGSRTRFLQDTSLKPEIGAEYSSFSFRKCKYIQEEHVVCIEAEITLPERNNAVCQYILMQAKVINMQTGLEVFSFEKGGDFSCTHVIYQAEKELGAIEGGGCKEDLAVMTVAQWKYADCEVETAAILDDFIVSSIADYEHIHPEKQKDGYIELKSGENGIAFTEGELVLPPGMNRDDSRRGETDTINIALFRKPDDLKDLDYLCSFGKDIYGRPYFTVPAQGKFTFKSNNVQIKDVQASCFIKEKDADSGYYLVVNSEAGIGNDNFIITKTERSVEYKWLSPWESSFLYGGGWEKYIFSYTMAVAVQLQYEGQEMTSTFFISTEDVTQNVHKVPYISIMWGCVAEDTRILLESGEEKEIKNIIKGERVATMSGTATVRNVWRGESEGYIVVSVGGRTLTMTPDHPVMTAAGWKKAGNLTDTDELLTYEKHCVKIESIRMEKGSIKTCSLSYTENDSQENSSPAKAGYGMTMIAEGFAAGNFDAQNTPGLF